MRRDGETEAQEVKSLTGKWPSGDLNQGCLAHGSGVISATCFCLQDPGPQCPLPWSPEIPWVAKQIIPPPHSGHPQGPSPLRPGAGPSSSVTAHGAPCATADTIMMNFPEVETSVFGKDGLFLIPMWVLYAQWGVSPTAPPKRLVEARRLNSHAQEASVPRVPPPPPEHPQSSRLHPQPLSPLPS